MSSDDFAGELVRAVTRETGHDLPSRETPVERQKALDAASAAVRARLRAELEPVAVELSLLADYFSVWNDQYDQEQTKACRQHADRLRRLYQEPTKP